MITTMTHRDWLRTLLMVGVMLAGLLPGCSTNPVTQESEPIFISRRQEIQIGEEASPQFEEQFGGAVPSRRLQEYITSVGMRVAKASDREMPYEFTLVSSDVPNAFALPGGKIFITAGLFERMQNERQLAAVLAHEVGHVAYRHNVHQIQRQIGFQVLAGIAGQVAGEHGQAASSITKVVSSMANLSYTRDDEYEADAIGIEYAHRAGYNPWGMVGLLTVLQKLSNDDGGKLDEMFRTHPLTQNRIDQARETLQKPEYRDYTTGLDVPADDQYDRMKSLLRSVLRES